MSALAHDFFVNNPAISGPIFAMGLFAVVFIIATVRAMRLSASHVDHMSRLVLDGETEERTDG